MSARLWDRAAQLPVPADDRPRAEVVALAPGLPTVADLFTFMRDAELRFGTLAMRIEDRTQTAAGEQVTTIDLLLRHPGEARVTTGEPAATAKAPYEVWISDGVTVRTYAAAHRLGTERPVRRPIQGLDSPDLPGSSKVYRPLTPLPMETLADTFVHPAGFCQNVLATGRCWIEGTATVAGRETILLISEHPRGTEVWADRPDHAFRAAVDRATGVILALTESVGVGVTRHAEVVRFEPDASLAAGAFDFTFPADTTTIY